MHLKALLALWLHAASAAASASPRGYAKVGCDILHKAFPSATFHPGSQRYDFENKYGWSTASWLGPACIFTPSTPEMVSFAVQTFFKHGIKFAIRGGGAMPRDTAANIGSEGILLANTNFTATEISEDFKVVSVGAGVKWPELYAYLDQFKVTANGIRMGDVGVIGTLLGGGLGFFGYEYGSISTSIESFECVLADGSITQASLTKNPDLFWALRGGGNNFCIVTRATLRTLDVPSVYLGQASFGSEVKSRYIQSMVDFAHHADAYPKTSVEGQVYWFPETSNEKIYGAFLFDSGDDPSTPGLQNFSAPVMPVISGNLTRQSMGTWANSFSYEADRGQRKIFHFMSIPADTRAMEICLDTYFAAIEQLADREGFYSVFSVMPITERFVTASSANGGNPLGLENGGAPAVWLVESPSWSNGADDADVLKIHDLANKEIDKNLAAEGFERLPYIYPSGDNSQVDQIIPGYGEENVQKLKDIMRKYDPKAVFTTLLPGGAKVAYA